MYLCRTERHKFIMNKTLILFVLFAWSGMVAFGQSPVLPRIHLIVSDTIIVDNVAADTSGIPAGLHRVTNFNSSIDLSDSTLHYIFDSLRTDGTATIMTVYETNDDNTVGLWQVGSGKNRALWLNSRKASYENFAISYRNDNEQGVIIHTMRYQYPRTDSSYSGHDTLYIGREGNNVGDKNFCEMLYFPGRLDHRYQRKLESALAIRYGALLHGPYVNSLADTLWNPKGCDSLYSFGVCGIGRDDRLSLLQPKSMIRNGYLSVEALGQLIDLTYVMMGHDGGEFAPGEEEVVVGTEQYVVFDRRWKLRARGNGAPKLVRIGVNVPLPADAVRLMMTNGANVYILTPVDEVGNLVFDSITIDDGQDYYMTLMVNPDALSLHGTTGVGGSQVFDENDGILDEGGDAGFRIMIHPNPTDGHYTAEVSQSNEDNVWIQVLDASGRLVEQHATDGKHLQYKYDGQLETSGVYYITIGSNGNSQTIKVIVVK